MRRALLPAGLALVALASGVAALLPPGTAGGPTAVQAVRVQVLSARRVPVFLSQLVADGRLRADLDAALADPALGGARERSCLVVRQGERPVLARRADQSLIPASTIKILTGLAVLARLGPGTRLATEARAQGPLGPGGVVPGRLWLVGGGDPLLATADYAASFPNQPQLVTPFEALADQLVAAGVRAVPGGVAGDESRYDTQRYVPTWKPGYIADAEVGPASALDVNDGFTEFRPRHVAAPDPATHAAAVLTGLLRARGVAVGDGPGPGAAPAGTTVVASVSSPPVGEIVGQMLRESDNLTAELLVKELGVRFGSGGTTRAGVEVVHQTLASAGLPVSGMLAVDGSGLDRSDRVSCDVLLAALQSAGTAGPLSAGLPVAARTGTLAMRFTGNLAAGRLRAKTGSLDGVVGLTGYVDSPGTATPLAFALLANDLPRDALGRSLQEQVGAILASYPQAPPPASLGP